MDQLGPALIHHDSMGPLPPYMDGTRLYSIKQGLLESVNNSHDYTSMYNYYAMLIINRVRQSTTIRIAIESR